MASEKADFPLYRKYPDGKTVIRVDSPEQMTEVKVIGDAYMITEINAKILPERVMIGDLIELAGMAEAASVREFEEFLRECRQSKKLLTRS